jgi:hypothetical protein
MPLRGGCREAPLRTIPNPNQKETIMHRPIPIVTAALCQVMLLAGALAAPAQADDSDGNRRERRIELVGLTADQRLIAFRADAPFRARDIGPITNLSGDSRIVGIDFRPATGDLYGLGNAGGVYTLDTDTAEATFRSQLQVSGNPLLLEGSAFGVDFNPTVDRLRVVSGVTGAAYTNNDADPNTATTLFDLDTDGATDGLFIQAPPNAGSLNITGNLGVDATGDVGFDILSRLRHGTTIEVTAFAALHSDRSRLYEIDLFTGRATSRGSFRRGNQVIGLAVELDREHHGKKHGDDD